jgi:hypothetical protein
MRDGLALINRYIYDKYMIDIYIYIYEKNLKYIYMCVRV